MSILPRIESSGSLGRLVSRIRLGGEIFGVVATFLPALVALLTQFGRATTADLITLLVPLAVVVLAWARPGGRHRVALSAAAAFAYLAGLVMLSSTTGITWPPIASATATASLIAICGLGYRWAMIAIVAGAALCLAGVESTSANTLLISTSLMNGLVTPLVDIVLGLAILITLTTWDRSARVFDQDVQEAHALARQAVLAQEVESARKTVDRQLHETVLNTLDIIAGSERLQSIREQCARDLEVMEQSMQVLSRLLVDVVSHSCARVPGITVNYAEIPDLQLPDERTARILGDSLVELLRNVQRHAGTSQAFVHASVTTNMLTLQVSDHGTGMKVSSTSRFGTRTAVRESIESVGGTAKWLAISPQGTEVSLTIPLDSRSLRLETQSALDVLLGPLAVRLAMLPTVVIGIIAIPFAAAQFTRPLAINLSFAAFALVTIILATNFRPRWRSALAWTSMALALLTLAIAAGSQEACSSEVGMHWVIFSAGGGVVLPILAVRSVVIRPLLTLAVILLTVFTALASPENCRAGGLDAAIENAVWLIVIIGLIAGLARAVDRYRYQAIEEWNGATSDLAHAAASAAASARWSKVTPATRRLLEDIAAGRVEPQAPAVQELARLEECHLRSLLELARIRSESLRAHWESVLEVSASTGTSLSMVLASGGELSHQTVNSCTFVGELTRACAGQDMTVTLLNDSVLCSVPSHSLPGQLPQDWRLLDYGTHGRAVVEWKLETARAVPHFGDVAASVPPARLSTKND